jgi:hypothetical protein
MMFLKQMTERRRQTRRITKVQQLLVARRSDSQQGVPRAAKAVGIGL